ncbi:hypothetical protein A4G20_03090 [Pasteurellaceae bacterium RH1A]|nr:hypothetical protein A4G20_03090 [Pasteurellaceae bacterium RH1A]
MNNPACPCQSGLDYTQCCGPLHAGKIAPSAESLMRSRYSAYVLKKIDYVVATTLPSQQKHLDIQAMQDWADQTQWLGLEVLHHNPKAGKNRATVEFKARFVAERGEQVHHELSLFIKQKDCWFFVDPNV